MKKYHFIKGISLVLFSGLILFSSCKKEEVAPTPAPTTTPTPTPTPSNSFTAKVDGVEFMETLYASQVSSGNIIISAYNSTTGKSIGLVFPENIAPGTYNLGGFTYQASYNLGTQAGDLYGAQAGSGGQLIITSNDTANDVVIGTFQFTAQPAFGNPNTNTFAITAGAFTRNY